MTHRFSLALAFALLCTAGAALAQDNMGSGSAKAMSDGGMKHGKMGKMHMKHHKMSKMGHMSKMNHMSKMGDDKMGKTESMDKKSESSGSMGK